VLCAVWVVCVTVIVLWETPVDRGAANLLERMLRFLHERGLPSSVDYGFVEFGANIVMFIPLGLFWFILAPRGWRWVGPLVGLGLSALIELIQHLLLPQRFATPQDVLANGLGTLAGTVIAWVALWLREGLRRLKARG
jgi:glycopeptide antibiotics resistance protein